ncbi:MAG: response regulator [Thermodesulfobacteriota bacterium]
MLRFLITDDDDVTHAFMRHVLLGQGDVTHAFSGSEAVELCSRALQDGTPFDCVLMDILMPGMDGWETIRAIMDLCDKAGTPPPKMVVTTCLPPSQYRESAKLPCPEDAYIHKPFDRRTVLAALSGLGLPVARTEDRGEDFW